MSFELTTIGQYASVQGGYAFKSPDFLSNGFRPVLKIKNVRHGYVDYNDVAYVSEEIATSCKKWETQDGDILISMTGSGPSAPESLVGRVARVSSSEPKALINQRVGRLILKDEHAIDKDFLFYVLSQKETQEYLVSNSTGSANQVNINGKTIESVSCPKVTFEESTQIASVLRALDKQVRLLRETNATLEAIAQALFKSWFVDFDPVHANAGTQAPSLPPEIQALFPATFTDSPQGPIPEGWSFESLASIMDIAGGTQPPASEFIDSLKEGYIRLIQIRDYETDSHLTYVPLTKNLRQTSSKDIMIARYGASVGRICWGLDGAYNVALIKVVCEENHREFLRTYLQSNQFQMRLAAVSGRSAQAGFNKGDIASFKLVFPCNKIFEQYQNSVWPLREKILHHRAQAIALEGLRDTLLPRLISGQLRLPELEQAVAAITD